MDVCTRPDIGEHLMMALSPADFPQEALEIQEHLKECPACRKEMEALRRIEGLFGENKRLMAEALSPCPSVDALSAFASGQVDDPSVASHLELCADCREHATLVSNLSREELDWGNQHASAREKSLFREAVAKQYGLAGPRAADSLRKLWTSIIDWLHVPSLAMGAAVAALLVFVLIPHAPEDRTITPVFSNVVWEKPTSISKGALEPKQLPLTKKKVALILLLHGPAQPLLQDVEQMYANLEIVRQLAPKYDFLSPRDIQQALVGTDISSNLMGISEEIFNKTSADYLLAFEILRHRTGDALRGTLFERGRISDLGSVSQTGLTLSRIRSRISTIGADLLLEATQGS